MSDLMENMSGGSNSESPKSQLEQEKRLRREIANSNERRRMQSINAGFQSLRTLIKNQSEGEKLSKAAILQQTSDYICQLEQDKSKLLSQNAQLKRVIAQQSSTENASSGNVYSSPHSPAVEQHPPTIVKRRKTLDGAVESADEGIGNMSPEHSGSGEDTRNEMNELRRETMELRLQLERERRHRVSLEEHIGILQQQQQGSYSRKFEQERSDELDGFQRVPTPGRLNEEAPRCYTIRNNLETIVEAIRHLEGDHLFSDDRNSTPASSTPSSSPTRPMECGSPGSSPSHSIVEVPYAHSSSHQGQMGLFSQSGTSTQSGASTTVTSLKHHVLNRIARSSEIVEEQPINLVNQYRPGLSRSPSPVSYILPHSVPLQFQVQQQQQQQLRPGVIVVKHS